MEIKELLLKDNNLKIAIELSKSIESVKEEVEEKFWEELIDKIDIPFEKDTFFDSSFKEINFYKEINLEEEILCFGLGRGKNSIYFFIGLTNREHDTWISPNFLDDLIFKFDKFQEKTINSKREYKMESTVWKYIKISKSTNFNIDDFYILLDTEERNDLILELTEYMQKMYQIINEIFDE